MDKSERLEQKPKRMVGQSYGRPPYDHSAEQQFDRKAVFDRLYLRRPPWHTHARHFLVRSFLSVSVNYTRNPGESLG